MRKGSIKELLAKIKYDEKEDPKEYTIVIEHRSDEGSKKEIPFKEIVLGHGYFFVGEAQIPYHRILEVRKNGKPIWKTRKIRF